MARVEPRSLGRHASRVSAFAGFYGGWLEIVAPRLTYHERCGSMVDMNAFDTSILMRIPPLLICYAATRKTPNACVIQLVVLKGADCLVWMRTDD